MPTPTAIRRVIIVVLDGLRPDAIDAYDLSNIRAMAQSGAQVIWRFHSRFCHECGSGWGFGHCCQLQV